MERIAFVWSFAFTSRPSEVPVVPAKKHGLEMRWMDHLMVAL